MNRLIAAAVLVVFAGCKHAPMSASKKYASAPRVENPLLGAPAQAVPGFTSENELFAFSTADQSQLCFDGNNTQAPAIATATKYSLRFLETDEVDLKNAASLKQAVVTVVASKSDLVPVTRTVQDTVRDSSGRVVATVDRTVQELEPRYQTQLRLCFTGPAQALTQEAKYMVLLREESNRGSWGIPMKPRASWVWRFPAADDAQTVAMK